MYDEKPKRINHRIAENYLCAKVREGHDLLPEDVLYLVGRIEALRERLDTETYLNELEVERRQEALRALADERHEREMLSEPIQ
jgi:shikimate kinase